VSTRVCFVADCHLGNHRRHAGPREASLNRRCREGLTVFRRAVQRAVELHAAAFVVLGDLFDDQRPLPQLVSAVQRILDPADEAGMRVHLLVGNHDLVSSALGDHALGPLTPLAFIHDRPTAVQVGPRGEVELFLVPFGLGGAPASDWLPDVVRTIAAGGGRRPDRRVLGVHLGIRDGRTAPWLRDAPDAVDAELLSELCAEAGVGQALAGNWHFRRQWYFDAESVPEQAVRKGARSGVGVTQLGALVPTGFDNPGLGEYGTLAVWEDGVV
jgi:hypothetical protein